MSTFLFRFFFLLIDEPFFLYFFLDIIDIGVSSSSFFKRRNQICLEPYFGVLLLDTFRFVSYQFSGLSILIYLRYKQGSLDYHNKEQKLPEQQSQL